MNGFRGSHDVASVVAAFVELVDDIREEEHTALCNYVVRLNR
jgi:hypothetical protein